MFAYNGTSTKGIVVRQPSIRGEIFQQKKDQFDDSVEFYLEQRFNLSKQ